MSGEEKDTKCDMTMDSVLLMMNLAEDDFIINVSFEKEDGDEEE